MADRPTLVFLSHRSHHPEEKRFLACLREGIELGPGGKRSGLKVLVDADLEPGSDWSPQLDEWMAECHAAVVLLTPSALKSQWVSKETAIVTWRRSEDPRFVLVPVRMPGVTDKDLDTPALQPLFLGLVQHARGGDAAAVAAQVKEALAPLHEARQLPKTPLESLTGILAIRLKRVDSDALDAITDELGVCDDRFRPGTKLHDRHAQRVARKVFRGEFGTIETLPYLMERLKQGGLSEEDCRFVLDYIGCFWVDGAAAGRLPALVGQPDRAAAVNGALVPKFTAEMYLKRAYPVTRKWYCVPVTGCDGEGRADSIEIDLIAAVRDMRNDPKLDVHDWLLNRGPFFVVVPPPAPDKALPGELKARFPTVTFMFATGPALPLADELPAGVERVTPELDVHRERDAYDANEDAEHVISP